MKPAHAAGRSAYCLMLARINLPHLQMWQDDQQLNITPFTKLLSKQTAFLKGELTSRANLERFFAQFSEWRSGLTESDTLGWQIVDLCNAALYASSECVFDDACDDTILLNQYVADIYQQMTELGAETSELKHYFASIQQEFQSQFNEVKHIPLPKDFFVWLSDMDVSLFGVAE
ncbi:hypothetical protein [Oceanobacter sp. 4_MG-2023]|uniref:hypothetical protein n=1 Tax=Oceanobacter sp. 4_MG-2023 TaxID=3062623 RepID=UPI00273268A8|nr:hypothetical protein [Oceanobacter sp. 4_MG-2023]MDP2546737.1 hypothetical protein [Oceanobacter sp. 4_MG-2023]